MRRWRAWFLVACLACAVPAARAAVPGARAGSTLRVTRVRLHIFHRAFRDFHDRVDARLREEFRIGDSEYTARIVEFVPDFTMNLQTHRITTRSQAPNNPAFRIVVRRNGVPQDTTWAFVDMPPHFARKSLVAFLVARVEFANHAPIVSHDSLAVRLEQAQP